VGGQSLAVALGHGATHRLGRYVRSVREAAASRAPRANGELVRWACARWTWGAEAGCARWRPHLTRHGVR